MFYMCNETCLVTNYKNLFPLPLLTGPYRINLFPRCSLAPLYNVTLMYKMKNRMEQIKSTN